MGAENEEASDENESNRQNDDSEEVVNELA